MTHTSLRRAGTALGAIATLTASALTLAPSAWAAGSLVDNGNGTMTATNVSFFGNNGLWICATSTLAAACNTTNFLYGSATSGVYQVGTTVFTSAAYEPLPAGLYNVQLVDDPYSSIALTNVRIGTAPPPSDPEPAAAPSGPAPIMQAFAAPTRGTCDETATAGLNWGGASPGGWTRSWQQWVNSGAGGPVCQRTLAYSAATGTWAVAS